MPSENKETSVSPEVFRTLARLKGKEPSSDTPHNTLHDPFPISTAWDKAEIEKLENPEIGQNIPRKGIFFGTWTPKDRNGKNLHKTFNLFAAPQILRDEDNKPLHLNFNDAAGYVAYLKDWHGHDGGNFENDKALYDAIQNGTYHGEWFIPTRDILSGIDQSGKKVQKDNLFQHRETGDLKPLFSTVSRARLFWSCTEFRNLPLCVWHVGFSDEMSCDAPHKNSRQLPFHLVRAEPRHKT